MKLPCDWTLASLSGRSDRPDQWIPASVPGCVQLDYASFHGWDDLHYGQNARRFDGLEERFWLYRTKPRLPVLGDDEALFLVAKGIDYAFEILVNGQCLHRQEGMFTPVELDLTGRLRPGDSLEVLICPAPKRKGATPHDRQEADQSCKPAVSYGWDWHPYLVVLGIWDECYLEVRPKAHLRDCEVFYTLEEDLSAAHIRFRADATVEEAVAYTLRDPEGKAVYAGEGPELTLSQPRLWWCRGQGEQALYAWTATLASGHSLSGTVGFRSIRLSVNGDDWSGPGGTRANPPMTITLNNRRIFAKGTNWVNPELFPGTITRNTYDSLLTLAVEANFNLLRVWGGAIVNKESFFELCDQYGLMVWQEFPLACNNYVGSPAYLRVLEQEAASIIRRVRRHPSHVLWCGGNELFNGWSRMTDQSPALRLLNKLCYEEDRDKPFLPTSPVMGVSHGSYLFRYPEGDDVMTVMGRKRNTAYTEFGVPSLADADYLRTFIPPGELFPPRPGASYEFHHAFHAWNIQDTWLCGEILEHYFGPAASLEELAARSQWLQCEGYKAIYEEARRQKPDCSMALNWCYNEPWKTAANNSLISYPARPKPALWAVGQSCRDVCASLRIPRFDWRPGETIALEPWLLNDSPEALPGYSFAVRLSWEGGELPVGDWEAAPGPANENSRGEALSCRLPEGMKGAFTLSIRCEEAPALDSEYRLLCR